MQQQNTWIHHLLKKNITSISNNPKNQWCKYLPRHECHESMIHVNFLYMEHMSHITTPMKTIENMRPETQCLSTQSWKCHCGSHWAPACKNCLRNCRWVSGHGDVWGNHGVKVVVKHHKTWFEFKLWCHNCTLDPCFDRKTLWFGTSFAPCTLVPSFIPLVSWISRDDVAPNLDQLGRQLPRGHGHVAYP